MGGCSILIIFVCYVRKSGVFLRRCAIEHTHTHMIENQSTEQTSLDEKDEKDVRPMHAPMLVFHGIAQQLVFYIILSLYGTKDEHMTIEYFCEANNNATLFAQQANAWSAVSYQVVVWICLVYLSYQRGSFFTVPMYRYVALAPLFIMLTGMGTMVFHGYINMWGAMVDFIAMDIYLCFELSVSTLGTDGYAFVGSTFFLSVFTVAMVYAVPPKSYNEHFKTEFPTTDISSAVIVVGLVATFFCIHVARMWISRERADLWLLMAAINLVIGLGFWVSFNTGCVRKNSIEGHAAWHVFTAITMGCVFMYRMNTKRNSLCNWRDGRCKRRQ